VKLSYGAEEIVSGKRDERFTVRRCTFVIPPELPLIQPDKGINRLQRLRFGAIVALFVVTLIGATFLWQHHIAAKTSFQRMEECRKDAESALDSLSWQDELPGVLKRWKEESLQLTDEQLSKFLLAQISIMEAKTKILAKPAVQMSLDAIAEKLSEAQRRQGKDGSTQNKQPL
jgi:hypothetical protein